jgi:hypothetical protein
MIDWAEAHGTGWAQFAWVSPADGDAPFSLVEAWDTSWDAGNGGWTRPPAPAGAPAWNSLSPQRVARGYASRPIAETF